MSVPVRPILRYPGGKWKIAPWIISHFPEHQVYVEPYGGGGSVLLRKERSNHGEVLNDLDKDVVNLFRVLRSPDAKRLISQVELTSFARDELDLSREQIDDPVEKARRFLVRSCMGRGSCLLRQKNGFRSLRAGGKMPPWDWRSTPASIRDVVERLKGVVIENRPAIEILDRYDGEDVLFYVDPPYPMTTRTKNKLYSYEMSDGNHVELAEKLHHVKGKVILSGYSCSLYEDLYQGWKKRYKQTLSDGVSNRVECLWLSPNAVVQGMLFTG